MTWLNWQRLPLPAKYQLSELVGASILMVLSIAESCAFLEVLDPGFAAEYLLNLSFRKISAMAAIISKMRPAIAIRVLSDMTPSDVAKIISKLHFPATQASLVDAGLLTNMTPKEIASLLPCMHDGVAAAFISLLDDSDAAHIFGAMQPRSVAAILEACDHSVAARILEAFVNDRMLASVLNELPSGTARLLIARFGEEQRTAIAWEAMHLGLGHIFERNRATYNFSWTDAEPWAMSPASSGEPLDDAMSLISEDDSLYEDSASDTASSCDGISAASLGMTRRRPEETPYLRPCRG